MMDAVDRWYLARAISLARRGVGNVSPNPPVGAVLVEGGETLGEGFHHRRGGPHAEVEALRDAATRPGAEERLRRATLYVSLEPCNHTGRTPPCSEAVVAAGVRRVVIGTLDPNPRTAYGGVQRLREAGIAVELADDPEAAALIAPFAAAMRYGRPTVTLKLAASLDGRIAPRVGPFWLTEGPAIRFVRQLRAEHDIVLVGAGTARTDDPDLTPRPPRTRLRPTLRGVVCGQSPPPLHLRLFVPQPGVQTLLFIPASAAAAYEPYAAFAEVIALEDVAGVVTAAAVLAALAEREVGSVLCEGGPRLAASWLAAGVVDRLEWLIVPRLFAGFEAPTVLHGELIDAVFEPIATEMLGVDLRYTLRRTQSKTS